MLQITIVWYAFFTAASGLTNLFGQMLIMRSLQGFSFGGEWTAGPVLVGEIVRAQHRGKAVGILSTSTRLCRLMVCTAG
jgi:MFS family permease